MKKKLVVLGYLGHYTTQLYRDDNKSLRTPQWKVSEFLFFRGSRLIKYSLMGGRDMGGGGDQIFFFFFRGGGEIPGIYTLLGTNISHQN